MITLLVSCKKQKEAQPAASAGPGHADGYKQYLIRKGEHSAQGNDHRTLITGKLVFQVLFDSSCIYTTVKSSNTTDVNKLYGFSDCNNLHHLNSARFGWRWNNNALEILAYCYVNGERIIRSLGNIDIGQPVTMSIRPDGASYVFEMNGTREVMPRYCSTPNIEGYQLYPYFGGDETAPHDVRIFIKEL
ncbi:MAG TPA: hypothetical protein VD996_03350 [Chitinophagaceae bacterium]|nr:hypothetical protein [Chitinophagaceae bacterium]